MISALTYYIKTIAMTKHGKLNYCIENGILHKISSMITEDIKHNSNKFTNNQLQSADHSSYFETAIDSNQIGSIKVLLCSNVYLPANNNNYAIYKAFSQKKNDIVDLLWNDNRVKNTLKSDRPDIYEFLFTKDLKNKISEF